MTLVLKARAMVSKNGANINGRQMLVASLLWILYRMPSYWAEATMRAQLPSVRLKLLVHGQRPASRRGVMRRVLDLGLQRANCPLPVKSITYGRNRTFASPWALGWLPLV